MKQPEKKNLDKEDITGVFCETLNRKGRRIARNCSLAGIIGGTITAGYTTLVNPQTYESIDNAFTAIGIDVLTVGLTTLAMYITASAARPVYQWFLYDNHIKEKTLEYIATKKDQTKL